MSSPIEYFHQSDLFLISINSFIYSILLHSLSLLKFCVVSFSIHELLQLFVSFRSSFKRHLFVHFPTSSYLSSLHISFIVFFSSQFLGLPCLLSPVCYMVIALFVAGMLSPTKEKGSGFGSKQLHKIQNMLHHRPRSGSWGHKHEKEKNEKISKYTCYNVLLNNAQGP